MRLMTRLVPAMIAVTSVSALATEPAKVVLIGDSIRLGYAPTVEAELAGKVKIISPKPNGGDSQNVLKHLDEWVIREQPAVVHFNCGIHDTKKSKTTGTFQVSPKQYEANLREIIARIRKETGAVVLFATSTPILDDRAAQARTKADYELLQASIDQYNQIALKVMDELKVPVDDLRTALPDDSVATAKIMTTDGVHFSPEGRERLGKQVAAFISQHLPSGAPPR
ncbi:SGNH/GDSL hydrolase family protein [Singulisphaera acidiphila]|uniref:Lysophospholipase L1-like esterase n=1 Tax=Singulisphaera acidiphila (strain ATCC BAA-1392 / DSM 18658 / VKM B-2454 / MOB10) TaxID=886293 RepID=L0DFZ6_SINAD|nr:SGNH/GDSL hydrolase family protein [Singulisphaera acidiphila]AGA27586.1 lysophospholipase L1-like esterase [Singulisphaera acidiphila DSM 18658]